MPNNETNPRGEENLGQVQARRLQGDEPFNRTSEPLPFTVREFWSWSCSDLLDNTMRGVLAEFIVACDLGVSSAARTNWNSFDLRTPSGITVEVKSTAYIQSWHQTKLSPIVFRIAPRRSWDPRTNTMSRDSSRSADVFVFCLLAHKDKSTIDPLNLDQWRFFVAPTRVLDARVGAQKTITLSSLLKLDPIEVRFGGIAQAIDTALKRDR